MEPTPGSSLMSCRHPMSRRHRARPNPSLHPTRYGWLCQPPRAGELKR
jgi:hypothetical protein